MRAATPLRTAALIAAAAAPVLAITAAAARPNAAAAGAAQAPAVPRPYVRSVDRWLGETRAVAVDGTTAYFSVGRSIAVADLGDPTQPRLIARSAPLPTADGDDGAPPISAIALGDGVLWAITGRGDDGVALFDVTPADAPRLRSQSMLEHASHPKGVAARGAEVAVGYAWPESYRGGLVVLKAPAGGPAVEVAVTRVGDVLGLSGVMIWTEVGILAVRTFSLVRVDLTEEGEGPRVLRVIGQTYMGDSYHFSQLVADGCHVVGLELGQGSDSAFLLDVCGSVIGKTEPRKVIERQNRGTSLHRATEATVMGERRIVLTGSNGGAWSIDWADLRSPGPLTATEVLPPIIGFPVCTGGVAASGVRLVVTGCGLTAAALDRPEPLAASAGRIHGLPGIESDPYFNQTLRATSDGDRIVLVGADVVSEMDGESAVGPSIVGQVRLKPEIVSVVSRQWLDVTMNRSTVWMSRQNSDSVRITAVDIRDPAHPTQVDHPITGDDASIAADDRTLVVASTNSTQIFRLAPPAVPRLVGRMAIQGPLVQDGFHREMIVSGNEVIVSAHDGWTLTDIADPAAPRMLVAVRTEPVRDVAVALDRIVVLRTQDVTIFDRAAARAGRSVPLATVPIPLEADGSAPYHHVHVTLVGARTHVVLSGPRKALSIDVTDSRAPIVGPPFRFPTSVDSTVVAGTRLYGIGHLGGPEVTVFDLSVLLNIAHILRLPFLANLDG